MVSPALADACRADLWRQVVGHRTNHVQRERADECGQPDTGPTWCHVSQPGVDDFVGQVVVVSW